MPFPELNKNDGFRQFRGVPRAPRYIFLDTTSFIHILPLFSNISNNIYSRSKIPRFNGEIREEFILYININFIFKFKFYFSNFLYIFMCDDNVSGESCLYELDLVNFINRRLDII